MTNQYEVVDGLSVNEKEWTDPKSRMVLSLKIMGQRCIFAMTINDEKKSGTYSMTTLPDTYQYYKNCSPWKDGAIPKEKELLWGLASHFARQFHLATDIDEKILHSRIREFCHPDQILKVQSVPDPYEAITAKEEVTQELNELSYELPGARSLVNCPEKSCADDDFNKETQELRIIIMHLNDLHKWNREAIADWLDDLYEKGLDLEFKDIPDGN